MDQRVESLAPQHLPETTAVDLGDQLLQGIVGAVAHSPALLKETGTAPRVMLNDNMLADPASSKENQVARHAHLFRYDLRHSKSIEKLTWSENNAHVVQGSAKQMLV